MFGAPLWARNLWTASLTIQKPPYTRKVDSPNDGIGALFFHNILKQEGIPLLSGMPS